MLRKQVVYKTYAKSLTSSYISLPCYFKTLHLGCCWPWHLNLGEQKKLSLLPKMSRCVSSLISSKHQSYTDIEIPEFVQYNGLFLI